MVLKATLEKKQVLSPGQLRKKEPPKKESLLRCLTRVLAV